MTYKMWGVSWGTLWRQSPSCSRWASMLFSQCVWVPPLGLLKAVSQHHMTQRRDSCSRSLLPLLVNHRSSSYNINSFITEVVWLLNQMFKNVVIIWRFNIYTSCSAIFTHSKCENMTCRGQLHLSLHVDRLTSNRITSTLKCYLVEHWINCTLYIFNKLHYHPQTAVSILSCERGATCWSRRLTTTPAEVACKWKQVFEFVCKKHPPWNMTWWYHWNGKMLFQMCSTKTETTFFSEFYSLNYFRKSSHFTYVYIYIFVPSIH